MGSSRVVGGAALVAALTLVSAPAVAQTGVASRGYMPPRTADGQPDLQGVWRIWNLAQHDIEPHSASQGVPAGPGVIVDPADGMVPYKPWALARKKENFAKSRITYPYDPLKNADPLARCYLPGVPRITYMGFPFEIIQARDFVAIVYEWMHVRRMIPLGDRPVLQGLNFWNGISRARWDGTSLVIRVTNVSDWTWLDGAGNFYSRDAVVEERYTPAGPDTLTYEVTIEDSNVLTRPMTLRMPVHRQRDVRLLEYECHDLLQDSGVPLTWERDWDQPLVIPKE